MALKMNSEAIRFFDYKFSFLLVIFTLPVLFLPKINLITVGSETAGLRLDDLILLLFSVLLFWAHFILNKKLYKIELYILAITAFAFFSFLVNRSLVRMDIVQDEAKIFYVFRFVEYFFFFYIGLLASMFFKGHSVIRLFFLWNLFLMSLQKVGVLGGITFDGYQEVSARVQGIASFPSEMGLILNFLFCYLIYAETPQAKYLSLVAAPYRSVMRQFYLYSLLIICGIFVVFTGNRISIIALIITFLAKLKSEFDFRSPIAWLSTLVITSLLLGGIIFVITKTESVYERSAELFSFKNIELAERVWENIDKVKRDPESMTDSTVSDIVSYDVSWLLRIHKWCYALKVYIKHPECYLQGCGPGFLGAALDGGWLRILTETGLIGLLLYLKFFQILYRASPQLKSMVIAFAINMIFFDAYLAYKTMSLLFLVAGYAYNPAFSKYTDHSSSYPLTSNSQLIPAV